MQFLIKDYQTHISLGVYPIELRVKNKVLLSIKFDYPADKAAISDDLADTIDYDLIVAAIEQASGNKHYHLIEHLIAELHKSISAIDSNISNLKISLKKLSAIPKADYVKVTL
ncbi:MAG: dihydroneopterin aldolase [Rickettsiales bacterium]|jgi:dihydroneopterin aldolase|nr:dihydroneopterin aldolase [Rickettsiales bacterium]